MNGLRTYKPLRARSSWGGKPKRPQSFGDLPKRLGESMVEKGPWRSETHLARVRAQRCLGCFRSGVEAHHCRKVLGPGWGQPPDWLAVPLCRSCHDEAHEGEGGERGFWARKGNAHLTFIAEFSQEGRAGLAGLAGCAGPLRAGATTNHQERPHSPKET